MQVVALHNRLAQKTSQLWRAARHACLWSWRLHLSLVAITVVYIFAEEMIADSIGMPNLFPEMLYASGPGVLIGLASTLLLAVAYGFWLLFAVRPSRPLLHAARKVRQLLRLKRLVMGVTMLIIVQVFIAAMSAFKMMIPHTEGFHWDVWLANLSPALGGMYAYQLLQPIFGHETVTVVLDRLYSLWFLLVWAVVIWQAFSVRDLRLRAQFWISFLLVWLVLGTFLATALASAGPCYYGRVTGLPDPFAPLMAYLHQVDAQHPLIALKAQEYLWTMYQKGYVGFANGISAMPSMHISIVTLLTLLGWQVRRGLGICLTLYTCIIVVGSVELGWHYLPDGIVAVIGTVAIWQVAGAMVRRRERPLLPRTTSLLPAA
jgi:PAP2 superfamily